MTMLKPRVSDEQIKAFKEALTLTLQNFEYFVLSVDYSPDMYLEPCLEKANIKSIIGTLPIKTHMWFENGGVQVSYGYGAKPEEILKKKVDN